MGNGERAVYRYLARQLGMAEEALRASAERDLEELGLDSHGLLRVLLDVEADCELPEHLDLEDAELATPTTLAAAVERRCAEA